VAKMHSYLHTKKYFFKNSRHLIEIVDFATIVLAITMVPSNCIEVVVFVSTYDFFMCPIRTHECTFYFTYSCTCLELFLRVQLMRAHDLAKYVWSLFIKRK
jgi:hypothetical protein